MKKQSQILQSLLCLLLVCSAMSGGTRTKEYNDVIGCADLCNSNKLVLVQKKVSVKYAYVLAHLTYTQFPDMAIQFYLPFDQMVNIKYKISTRMSSNTWFITYMNLDDQQVDGYNCIDQGFVVQNQADDSIFLTKGWHHATVYYMNSGPQFTEANNGGNWPTGLFRIRYYRPYDSIPM